MVFFKVTELKYAQGFLAVYVLCFIVEAAGLCNLC